MIDGFFSLFPYPLNYRTVFLDAVLPLPDYSKFYTLPDQKAVFTKQVYEGDEGSTIPPFVGNYFGIQDRNLHSTAGLVDITPLRPALLDSKY